MFVKCAYSLLLALVGATANGMDATLETFVQAAVPEGGIFFSGVVHTNEATYNLFVLEQDERRGVMVVANNSVDKFTTSPQVLFADTSVDVALDLGLIPSDVSVQLCALLGKNPSTSNQSQTIAGIKDIYPLGAALNTVLTPITGFTFRSNSTLGILQELEQSDAIPVSPGEAPVGAILISPTSYSPAGPISLGAAAIVGSDHKVYGPDVRKGCGWVSFGGLEAWITRIREKQQLFAFVLRAHPDRT
jgi:hypothetical protein